MYGLEFLWSQSQQQDSIGAIDVIAVRKSDGNINCSPFHVRFQRTAGRRENKVVRLKVNGKESNISMKLGSMGEVFFVEKVKYAARRKYESSAPNSPFNESLKSSLADADAILKLSQDNSNNRYISLSQNI